MLLFGSVVQGISTVFSHLDFEVIFDNIKNYHRKETKNMKIKYLEKISEIIKKEFKFMLISANAPIIQAKCKTRI